MLGRAPMHEDLFRSTREFCDERVPKTSLYALLARELHRLFPDQAFADLFADVGRRSIPPRIVAVVMVLQRFEGLSDREAVDRFTFDLRWKYAAGCLDLDAGAFVHTVLVDMREGLRRSARPDRIFDAALELAKQAGLVGRKGVLDSTALYDAVATHDTVTPIRSAIRAQLRVAGEPLASELRGALRRDDDYASAGKPACEWDDDAAREALVDASMRSHTTAARSSRCSMAVSSSRPSSRRSCCWRRCSDRTSNSATSSAVGSGISKAQPRPWSGARQANEATSTVALPIDADVPSARCRTSRPRKIEPTRERCHAWPVRRRRRSRACWWRSRAAVVQAWHLGEGLRTKRLRPARRERRRNSPFHPRSALR